LDWEGQFKQALDPEKARAYRDSSRPKDGGDVCTMCGDFCAVKRVEGLL
ncbi:MAG: thiamine biosynthesis protein ThiC, partial [Candidatus Electrothrix sp. LOE2]|nr:thiamine biosynthesis protein ThiC [Candidatus Electrothrix sp. LOE2]